MELVIRGRPRDLGGFSVRRILPSPTHRMVGPFIFFDHMGPADFPSGHGIDVRPHPHIHLATVTYLFEGEIIHKDSLGSDQPIRPGAINWMTAGRGIVHSERTGPELRQSGSRLHGIQLWVAVPQAHEESDPAFYHHPATTLPKLDLDGTTIRVLLGSAFGATSPVVIVSPMVYVEAAIPPGGSFTPPADYPERAIYIADGSVSDGPLHGDVGEMWVIAEGATPRITSERGARVVLIGGAPLDGPRHIYWNFVSSSKERIEQAKRDWREGRFPKVPGDEVEFIPLPDDD